MCRVFESALTMLLWMTDGINEENPDVVDTNCCRACEAPKVGHCGSACIILLRNYACHDEGGDEWHWVEQKPP
ncbi:hypothetical protein DER45DRAFT_545357 [Fusarium avenaceum]|nr:hypothetical protein DER45DRAFT_545357 [Fusarium avenaceum]